MNYLYLVAIPIGNLGEEEERIVITEAMEDMERIVVTDCVY